MERTVQNHTTIHTLVMAHDLISKKKIYYLSNLQQYCH